LAGITKVYPGVGADRGLWNQFHIERGLAGFGVKTCNGLVSPTDLNRSEGSTMIRNKQGVLTMPDESGWSRADVAQWVGTLLWIVLLESHVISRPLVFLFGPFIVLLSFVTIGFPIPVKRLRQISLFAVATSIGGFLLTKYVF
jgi:hypothetical protein